MKVNNYLTKNGVKVLLFYLFTFLPLHAQDSLLLRNYQFVKQQDAWLTGSNGAGLTHFQQPNISEAEVSLQYATGGLTPFGGASNVLQVKAGVESFYRISQRTVVFGAISYDNWTGRNMTGSVFMKDRLPFDIVEQTEENSGKKHRDVYQLSGAVGVDLWKGYSIGARVDYKAANYAKYKDLRHSNKLMNLLLSVGVTAPVGTWLSIGANYLYHRQTESVSYHTYGKNDRVYKSLIDFGNFMGYSEQYGSTGYTDNSREMPLVEDENGGSLQLTFTLSPELSFYNELTMTHKVGYYGRKSPYTIVYTNHHSNTFKYHGRLAMRRHRTQHLLDIQTEVENLVNNRETYREQKNEAGAYYYEYFSDVRTGNKRWLNVNADYSLHLGIRGEQPTWSITAGCHWQQRKQTAYLYPYYRHQRLTTTEFTASVRRSFLTKYGLWTATLNGSYQKGFGEPYEDGTFSTPSAKQNAPDNMNAFLWQDYHLLTSPQFSIGVEMRYAFQFPGTRLLTHIRGNLQYRHANALTNDLCPTDLGNTYTTTTLALGCTF